MSKVQMLRCFVSERLTAAAEEIFALFERTISEYEEELCRSKEEDERKLDSLVHQRVPLHRADIQLHSQSLDPSLKKEEVTETTPFKKEPEEQNIKQEKDQLQVLTAISLSEVQPSLESLLQQGQSEHRKETQGEDCGEAEADISLDPLGHLHSETEDHTDNDEDCGLPVSSSSQQMELEADGDHTNRVSAVQNSHLSITTFTSSPDCGHNGDRSGTDKPYSCTVCKREFNKKWHLMEHSRTHTGEKPYTCTVCKKSFCQNVNLKTHMRTHTGEKPYTCSVCKKEFNRNWSRKVHMRTHTGEKPYSCSACGKGFLDRRGLNAHVRSKPFSCTVCKKTVEQTTSK